MRSKKQLEHATDFDKVWASILESRKEWKKSREEWNEIKQEIKDLNKRYGGISDSNGRMCEDPALLPYITLGKKW